MKPAVLFVLAALLVSSCATPQPVYTEGLTWARLGQTIFVDGPRITPLKVLEDSRCPINARCAWAGQVRLTIRVTLGRGPQNHEISSGKPLPIADGALELIDVRPGRDAGSGKDLKPADYRFAFRFAGGL